MLYQYNKESDVNVLDGGQFCSVQVRCKQCFTFVGSVLRSLALPHGTGPLDRGGGMKILLICYESGKGLGFGNFPAILSCQNIPQCN